VYEKEWLNTVESFFREKNRAWLSDSNDTLLHFLAGTPADCASWREVRALREALGARQGRFRKAKTNLQVLSANWQPEGERAVVEALESVRFFYDVGGDIHHEARQVHHQLTLMNFGGHWRVVRDEADREGWHVLGRQEEDEDQEGSGMFEVDERDEELSGERFGTVLPETRGRYDRVAAFKYAELWWNGYNPAYQRMSGNDCTNFISQVLHAGGMPMIFSPSRSKGWWYKGKTWSYSWTVAHSLKRALPSLLHAQNVTDPRLLKVGDVICYDWNGDGRWQHNTVVVDFDAYGMPLINAHTVASHRRYWDYRDSYAYTPRTQYLLYHIPDNF
jgi:hypothetical protein